MLKLFSTLSLILFLSACTTTPVEETSTPDNTVSETSQNNTEVSLTVIDCPSCQGRDAALQIKEKMINNLKIKTINADTMLAKELITKFDVKTLPVFVFNDAVKNSEMGSYLSDVTIEKDGEYLLLQDAVRLQTGKELLSAISMNDFDVRTSGSKDSSIQIVEFANFACSHCATFAKETLPKLKAEYGDKISFIFKNLPFTENSDPFRAAEAVQCAADQNKFNEMHDVLFENYSNLSAINILKYAEEIALSDLDKFKKCFTKREKKEEVLKQMADAKEINVMGTPAFIINQKEYLGGAYPFESFKAKFDQMLGLGQRL